MSVPATQARRRSRKPAPSRELASLLSPPSWFKVALEGRAFVEWTAWLLAAPWFSQAPKGDGHPVLVLPGLLAGDSSTWPLRRFLEALGYPAYPWEQGINRGPRAGLLPKLITRIETLHDTHGTPVSLIGWSLGGAMARALAHRMPERVRSIVTLGSPLIGDGGGSNATRVFEWASGMRVSDPRLQRMMGGHPPVPVTSILSKSDGVVDWRMSLTPEVHRAESIEVSASHLGMGANPIVLWAIADRLAQHPETWQPFERSGWRQLLYRDPRKVPLEDLFGG